MPTTLSDEELELFLQELGLRPQEAVKEEKKRVQDDVFNKLLDKWHAQPPPIKKTGVVKNIFWGLAILCVIIATQIPLYRKIEEVKVGIAELQQSAKFAEIIEPIEPSADILR